MIVKSEAEFRRKHPLERDPENYQRTLRRCKRIRTFASEPKEKASFELTAEEAAAGAAEVAAEDDTDAPQKDYVVPTGPLLPESERVLDKCVEGLVAAANKMIAEDKHAYLWQNGVVAIYPTPGRMRGNADAWIKLVSREYDDIKHLSRKEQNKTGIHTYAFAMVDFKTGDIFKPTNGLHHSCDRKRCGPPRGTVYAQDYGASCIHAQGVVHQGTYKCPVCHTSCSGYFRNGMFRAHCSTCGKGFHKEHNRDPRMDDDTF